MEIIYIGLGKMGFNMVSRLSTEGYQINAFDLDSQARERAEALQGVKVYKSLEELFLATGHLKQRIVWVMVPAGVVGKVISQISGLLNLGDVVIDGGNTHFKDTLKHAQGLEKLGVELLDVGVSGGPRGAREGACLMIGGSREIYEGLEDLFEDLSLVDGYKYVGKSGAGHFVKMIHNGIEYGMMQAIAEGFNLLRQSEFDLDLKAVADIYNNGSVIESRLINWLYEGFESEGVELENISGQVGHSGEGQWTVEYAREVEQPAEVIKKSLQYRIQSQGHPSYLGKILSLLRNQFGGHQVTNQKDE